ncbi:MAG: hypothetical protein ACE5KM_10620 [Planctomycetaceae bacterium]
MTYARDAWHYYSGEGYALGRIHAPEDLLHEVLKRHPEVTRRKPISPVRQVGGTRP